MKHIGIIKKLIAASILSCAFTAITVNALSVNNGETLRFVADAPPDVVIDNFSGAVDRDGLPLGWRPYKLPRKKTPTRYSVQREGDNWFLKADSKESASAVYQELDMDIFNTPVLKWRWKIDHTLKKGDETRREGDDYAGRIYVTFEYEPEKTSFVDKVKHAFAEKLFDVKLPGKTVSYIWSNKLARDNAAFNPFTDNIIMIAVESGDRMSGQWLSEERNVLADYRRYFHEEPPKVTGIVLMTDTDNTRESTIGYYDEISFCAH